MTFNTNENSFKIAILYICTGKYDVFWRDFYISCEKYFLPNSDKKYFVFTDAEELYAANENAGIYKIYQKRLGWPYDTLMRFELFSHIEDELIKFDYVFFFNANVLFLRTVNEEELLNDEKELFVVAHPGWTKCSKYFLPYERNKKSTAYIPYGKGSQYFMGGVNGGTSASYIKLIKTLKRNIQTDLDNHYIAKWHDESHLNRYMIDIQNYRILSPSFGYPEKWVMPYEPIVLIRDKDLVFNTSNVKGYVSSWVNIKKIIRGWINRLFHR